MSLPVSSSAPKASNLERLDERIQRWVWQKGWTGLRDAQEEAIPVLLQAEQDVIIAAATASGKTEAAFLPILSKLLSVGEEMGVALYIGPLKALINDQWGRLDQLCEELNIPVVPWHGDIAATRKRSFMKRPQGVLLITPESLEAQFVLRGHELKRYFGELQYVVVDELHAFLGDVASYEGAWNCIDDSERLRIGRTVAPAGAAENLDGGRLGKPAPRNGVRGKREGQEHAIAKLTGGEIDNGHRHRRRRRNRVARGAAAGGRKENGEETMENGKELRCPFCDRETLRFSIFHFLISRIRECSGSDPGS